MRHFASVLFLMTFIPAAAFAEPCRPVDGLAAILQPKAVVLFGELHGTVEAPAFVANALCLAAEAGHAVTLALEVPHEEGGRLAAFLASEGGAAARSALLEGDFWKRPYQDGRSSRAMADLLETARALQRSGKAVEVFLFDAAEADLFAGPRDGQSAGRADRRFAGPPLPGIGRQLPHPADQGAGRISGFEPMGYFLSRSCLAARMVALDLLHAGGSAWMCFSAAAEECGENPVGGNGRGADWQVTAGPAPDTSGGTTATFYVGALHASPPGSNSRRKGRLPCAPFETRLLGERRLRPRRTGDRHAVGAAGDVVEPGAVEEARSTAGSPACSPQTPTSRPGLACAALHGRHFDQGADADLVERGEGILPVDAAGEVVGQEAADVVAREAAGELGQVVGAEAEEIGDCGDGGRR